MHSTEIKQLNEKAKRYAKECVRLRAEIQKVIVGQDEIIDKLIMAVIADGHVLVEGVPGLAKTLILRTLASIMQAKFQRIQFTPDLLPADILGTKIFSIRSSTFSTKKGPIFANFVLADEINRAPPKCQSALLESMQEKQVTIGEDTFILPKPFFVMASMNPLEHEGVYTLPEAQVDRFMFKLIIRHPSREQEHDIITRMTEGRDARAGNMIDLKSIARMQRFCREIYADDKIKKYVTEIIDATRNPGQYGIDDGGYIEFGASPRASIYMILAAKAHAILNSRGYVIPEDIKAVCHDILRHRILLTYEAEAESVSTDMIIDKVLKRVKVP